MYAQYLLSLDLTDTAFFFQEIEVILLFSVSLDLNLRIESVHQFLVYLGQGGKYYPARGRITYSLRFSGSPRISKTLLRTHCGHFSIAFSSCARLESRLAFLGGAAPLM